MRWRTGLLLLGAALVGCSSAEDEAARIDQHYTNIATLYGMSVNDLRKIEGVRVDSDPGTSPECLDICSSATIGVDAVAASSGPTSLQVIKALLASSVRNDPPPSEEQGPRPISGSYVIEGRTMSIELSGSEDGSYSISFD